RVKKWVEPIQALMVPNGCSTVCRSHAHGVWHPIEHGLHCIENTFVLPALDPLHFLRGAPRLERTGEASGQMAVLVDMGAAVRSHKPSRQMLAGWAGVMILLGVVDEVLPGEQAALGVAGCQGLRHNRRDARAFAREDLVAVEVATVGQGGDFLA